MMPAVEIAVQDAHGAAVAAEGGADRVELCTALLVGGLTPSIALAEAAVGTGIGVHALVRPRAGGFVYTAPEVSVMVRDIEALVDVGVAGVVIGALRADRTLDRHAIRALVRAAEGREVTVHRCVDVLDDPASVVAELADLGVARVLTSGGAPRAVDGTGTLAAMVERSAGRVEVMAGGGVRIEDIPALLAAGVGSIHLSARTSVADAGPAGPGGGPATYEVTDAGLVAAAVAAARA
nr:copper homeostasis protein CutC [Georgenia faecalis]